MPTGSTHERFSKLILGNSYSSVHAWKDEPVRRLGANHRDVRHGPIAAYRAGKRFNLGAAIASIIHDLQDGHLTTWLTVIGGSYLAYTATNTMLRNNSSRLDETTRLVSQPLVR
jgi:hypothetical protein